MTIAFKTDNTNAQDVADAIQGAQATAESNLPSARVNLVIVAYPLILLVLVLAAAIYFVLPRSDLKEIPQSERSAASASSQFDVGSKNR